MWGVYPAWSDPVHVILSTMSTAPTTCTTTELRGDCSVEAAVLPSR